MITTETLGTIRTALEGKKCTYCGGNGVYEVHHSKGTEGHKCGECNDTGLDPAYDKLRALFVRWCSASIRPVAPIYTPPPYDSWECRDCGISLTREEANKPHNRANDWQDAHEGALFGSIFEVLWYTEGLNPLAHSFRPKYFLLRAEGIESTQAAADALLEALK